MKFVLIVVTIASALFFAAPARAACTVPHGIPFQSPLRSWEQIEDAGFGDEGLRRGHLGIDLFAPYATPVYAAADGLVVRSVVASMRYKNPMGKADVPEGQGRYFGTNVVLGHENGLYTLYGHLSEVSVAAGQHVLRGQQIGLSGNTGSSTGPHLHFALASSDQMWGYSYYNFKDQCCLYEGVTYYNPQSAIAVHDGPTFMSLVSLAALWHEFTDALLGRHRS